MELSIDGYKRWKEDKLEAAGRRGVMHLQNAIFGSYGTPRHIDSGQMYDSVTYYIEDENTVVIETDPVAENGVHYADIVRYGRGEIRPVNAKKLRWEGGLHNGKYFKPNGYVPKNPARGPGDPTGFYTGHAKAYKGDQKFVKEAINRLRKDFPNL